MVTSFKLLVYYFYLPWLVNVWHATNCHVFLWPMPSIMIGCWCNDLPSRKPYHRVYLYYLCRPKQHLLYSAGMTTILLLKMVVTLHNIRSGGQPVSTSWEDLLIPHPSLVTRDLSLWEPTMYVQWWSFLIVVIILLAIVYSIRIMIGYCNSSQTICFLA